MPAARWWNRPVVLIAVILSSALPLLWPDIPPLVDLPGHIARYRIQLDGGQTPWLADWYGFEWKLIGNLGVDLLIILMAKIFGLELGVKLIVMVIPPLTVAGLLWIAHEVHGRVPPTAFFALPLAYGFPFHFGFVNFVLSIALAFLAFALWLHWRRSGRLRRRTVMFVPISILIWITHAFGWVVLGVLAFSSEFVRRYDEERNVLGAAVRTGMACLPLAMPIALMIIWRSGEHVGGETEDWFNWSAKADWMVMVLRDRWELFDILSFAALVVLLAAGIRGTRIVYSRQLAMSALCLLAVYILLPRIVFGSHYADMRLVPFVIAIAVIALRPTLTARGAGILAGVAMVFFAGRIAGNTASLWLYDRQYDRELAALQHIPTGARLVSFTNGRCGVVWAQRRTEHLPGMALVRNTAYTNDQWAMAGAQLLTVRYRGGGDFTHDSSQITSQGVCPTERWPSIDTSLRTFPRDGFDYVWLIDPPGYDPASLRGLTPVWRDGNSMVLKVDR